MATSLPQGLKELLNELEEYAPAVRALGSLGAWLRGPYRQLRPPAPSPVPLTPLSAPGRAGAG